jgi:hypothetical protein
VHLMDDFVPKKRPSDIQTAKYYLSAQVYCCEFNDGAIILDMRTATYLGIDAEHARILRTCIETWPNFKRFDRASMHAGNPDVAVLFRDLIGRGILTTAPTKAHSSQYECPTTGWTDPNWGAARRRIPISHFLLFSASSLQVLLRRRGRGLASLLRWIDDRQAVIHRTDGLHERQQGSELLESFFRLRIWFYTAYRHCLLDSLVLSIYLTRRTIPCTLVIGVSTRPFAAHAWVQIGECVLNDTAEHVQTFTPIRTVGEFK